MSVTLYGMETATEFHVTEDGMRAMLETCHRLSIAVTELSRQLDATQETVVDLHTRMGEMDQRSNTERGYIVPSWR